MSFNEFLNNNDNVEINKKILINFTRYLTNDERLALKKNLNNGKTINAKMKALVNKKLNSVNMKALDMSPMKLGFFNAIVNDTFDKKERLDLVHIFNKKPHARKSIPRTSLDIEIKSIKLYYGQFKVGAEHSLKGVFGEVDPKKKYFMVQITAKVFDGADSQGITFRLYRNGKIHFSGGILKNNIKHPEQIRKYIVDTFTNREIFLYGPITYNNTTAQFNVNGAINLSGVARDFRVSSKIDYEPELRAALRINYMGISYQLFTTGIIQILGVRNEQEMIQAYEYGKDLARQLYVLGLLRMSKATVPKTKKVSVSATDTIKSVYERLESGKNNGNKNGITVTATDTLKSICEKWKKKKTVTVTNKPNVSYNTKKDRVVVAKKMCTRYPKPELVDIAKKLGVVNIKATTSKDVICSKIKDHVFGTFKVGNTPCLAYTKSQLIPLAVAKGISVTDNDTVSSICEKLKVPAKKVAVAKKSPNTTGVKVKRRLTNNTIKNNLSTLYGKKWLNTYRNVMPSLNENVAEIKKRINILNVRKNKMGLPFKKDVNALKKSSVRAWKFSRKKMLNNALNKMNNALANELENILEPTKKNIPKGIKKKFPKGTKVEQL